MASIEHKYLNSLIECIVETETQQGSFLSNMRVDGKKLEQIFLEFLEEENEDVYRKVMIGIDTNKNDKVIACVVGEDLKDVLEEISQKQEDKVMEQYCAIQREVFKGWSDEFGYGELMVVDSYGVRQEYQELKLGQLILQKYADYIHTIGYKALTGLCTSRSCLHICRKMGGKVVKSIQPKELEKIDPSLSLMFKESIDIPLIKTGVSPI